MDYIKVKDKDHLARDINSNGIVNFDVDGYNQYAENYKRVYNESKRINTLENDVSSIIEMSPSVDNKQKDGADANMDLNRAFDLNTNKYYDTCLKLEIMKGIIDNDNIEEIKCSYQNNKLINMHDELKSNSSEKNPALLYISHKVLDISMFKKKSNTTRKQRTRGGRYKHNVTKKVGGWMTTNTPKPPKPKPPKPKRRGKIPVGTVQTLSNSVVGV